ncbi:hypothetical protein [Aquimarina macrocephali]|uniref:hypothetical protein n=1 Tax=Aquimarina macrocephali TaxID=666563 RepID=UPI003F67BD7A
MIINGSYFVGELYLSQVSESASVVVNNKLKNTYFIDEYEREILEKGLGYKMCKDLYLHIDNQGSIKTTSVDSVWDDLLNGKEYQKDGKTFYWPGLVEKVGLLHKSMMAYYIYFMYLNDDTRKNTTSGTVSGSKKSEKVSVSPSTTDAWRKMVKWYGGSKRNTSPVITYHNGAIFEDYCGDNDNTGRVSMYQYLSDHKESYPDWQFTPIENINRFGI